MVRTHTDEDGIVIAGDDGEIIDDGDDDRVDPDDEGVELLTDGGRPPLSSYDHAPTVGPSDVDKCYECGRYAPHGFDHAPDCSRFEPTDTADSVTPSAANNPRMVRHATDGGTVFDKPGQSPERIASAIVEAQEGDRVAVHTWQDPGPDESHGTLSVFDGVVADTEYEDAGDHDGTHTVTIDVRDDLGVSVRFERRVEDGKFRDSDPVLYDPSQDERLPVTRFDIIDD